MEVYFSRRVTSVAPHPPASSGAAAAIGSALTTYCTFLPCFLFIFVAAPYIHDLHEKPGIGSALGAVTAAVVGVILNLAMFFAYHVLWPKGFSGSFDWVSALIGAVALAGLFHFKWSVFTLIGTCAAAGLVVRLVF